MKSLGDLSKETEAVATGLLYDLEKSGIHEEEIMPVINEEFVRMLYSVRERLLGKPRVDPPKKY